MSVYRTIGPLVVLNRFIYNFIKNICAAPQENLSSTRSDTIRALQLLDMAKRFEILDLGSGGYVLLLLYYPSSENKGANHLHGYCEAEIRLCFSICKNQVFSWHGSFVVNLVLG